MAIYVGSARSDENGKLVNGKAGDGKQTTVDDYKGEVSQQTMYKHSKGWNIFRYKNPDYAVKHAKACIKYCNDANVGYDQNNRYAIMTYTGTGKVECDCSSLQRRCIKDATGIDVGNFTTATAKEVLMKSGLFEFVGKYESQAKTPVYNGDLLNTLVKGHIVAVTKGSPRPVAKEEYGEIVAPEPKEEKTEYYPKYKGNTVSIVMALLAVGEKDPSYKHRSKIAKKNNIKLYVGTAKQNGKMIEMLKAGKLLKA